LPNSHVVTASTQARFKRMARAGLRKVVDASWADEFDATAIGCHERR
jgi:hypothetical protein